VLFISWRRTDVPEKYSTTPEIKKYQTWFPQFDPANLAATNTAATGK
jgi:hypothetical protein